MKFISSQRILMLVLPGLAIALAAAEPSPRLNNLQLEGVWITTFKSDGPPLPPTPPATSLTLFHRDGGLINLQDGANPPGILGGGGGLGEWAITGDNQFAVTTMYIFASVDAMGNGTDAGYFKQRWTVKYNEAHDQLSGPFQFAAFDAKGVMLFQASGTVTLKRLGVEAMSTEW